VIERLRENVVVVVYREKRYEARCDILGFICRTRSSSSSSSGSSSSGLNVSEE
jgi:hypothetical protein